MRVEIKRVTVKNFKKYKDQKFDVSGSVVLAGPNNSGKTTLIQAIAVWNFAVSRKRAR
jgi:predicted ATPase